MNGTVNDLIKSAGNLRRGRKKNESIWVLKIPIG